jgi:glucosamine--fructose-6-phosphate aminotransferase (isomerizing)
LDDRTLVVAISQRGETMDTLMAVRYTHDQGAAVVAITNTQSSSIAREADASLYTHAGPEIAVASTKAFVAQITATYLLGIHLAKLRGNLFADEAAESIRKLKTMPAKIQQMLDQSDQVEKIAQNLKDSTSVLFLGRHVGYPIALEGALKLKEIAYIHAEGFAAGELKHGPIALIEPRQPVFVIVPSPKERPIIHSKILSNIQEIKARGAYVIAVAHANDTAIAKQTDWVFRRPACPVLFEPLLDVIPLQIFACALATLKGLDVDKPRNLAKSVTVE